MAETGEPYAVARRNVIRDYGSSGRQSETGSADRESRAFAAVRAELISYGEDVRARIRPPAVGVAEIHRRFAAVAWFRSLGHSVDAMAMELDRQTGRATWHCRRCGSEVQVTAAASWASSTGQARCVHEGAAW
jgi:hypothetical protein